MTMRGIGNGRGVVMALSMVMGACGSVPQTPSKTAPAANTAPAIPLPKTVAEYLQTIEPEPRYSSIRVFVAEPLADRVWKSSEAPRVIHAALVQVLQRAGFTVVTSPLDPHELIAQFMDTLDAAQNTVHYRLKLSRENEIVEDLRLQWGTFSQGSLSQNEFWLRGYSEMFSAAARRLIRSRAIASVAREVLQGSSTIASPVVTAPMSPSPSASTLIAAAPQPTAYALVIGIERYRDLPVPSGAKADAQAFADIIKTTLGLPESNIRVAIDDRATRTDLERHLAWLKTSVPANGRVYFFFSGHGAPDAVQGTPYLMPYDANAQSVGQTGLPLAKVLEALSETKAKETLAFVDACFSGAGGRSVLAPGARPLVRVQEPKAAGAIALFASSSGSEISGPSSDGRQGAFTKYVVEALGTGKADIDGDGQLTLKELVDWVSPRVTREAKQQERAQTPQLVTGKGVGNPSDVAVVWGLR